MIRPFLPRGALAFRPYPPRRFARALVVRSAVIWLGLRAGVAGLGGVSLDWPAATAVIAIAVWLTGLDARRLNEDGFLANLGVPFGALLATAAIAPTALETTAALLPLP